MSAKRGWAIAIPARNEAERIGDCLGALARQRDVALADGAIVVLANDCTDETAAVACASNLGTALHVVEHRFAPGEGSAGQARRLAMAQARRLVSDAGILLTTDADSIADDDWVATMLRCFADRRIDLVAGRISGNWDEMQHHPADALAIGALECRYGDLIVQVEDLLDPLPYDPAPRHGQECGANVGIRVAMFDQVGGVPALAVGEDRALIAAVVARDGRVRHAIAPHVTASARLDGRAEGGMATALRTRIEGTYLCDELMLPAAVLEARLRLRATARSAFAEGRFTAWAAQYGVSGCHQDGHFGSSWSAFVDRHPALAAAPLLPSDLPAQITRLEHLLAHPSARHVA